MPGGKTIRIVMDIIMKLVILQIKFDRWKRDIL